MSRLHVLTAGVALAAVVAVSSTAEAGSRRYKPCRPGGWYNYPSATRYYAPSAPPAAVSSNPSTAQPPAPAGSGVVRRFSYEPGTEGAAAAPATASPTPVVRQSAPAYRPAARSSGGNSGGGFKAGLTGGDRLRPGTRNR